MVRLLPPLSVVLLGVLAGCINDADIEVYVRNSTQQAVSVHAQIVRVSDAALVFDKSYDLPPNSSAVEPSKVHLALGRYFLNATAGNLSESIERGLSDSNGGWSIIVYPDRMSSFVDTT